MPTNDIPASPSPVRPVSESPALRALAALEELAIAPRTAAEIARRFDVNRSTSLRLLKELELGGYVSRDPVTLRYRVLPQRFFALTGNHDDDLDVIAVVNPLLKSLREQSGEGTMFGVPTPNFMVYMAYYASVHAVGVRERIGTVRPMHSSALGKAYLSTLDPVRLNEELEALTFQGGTENAAQNADALLDDIEAARERGFALDVEETFVGVSCVAAPIRLGGSVIGSVGISGPCSRLDADLLASYGTLIVAELAQVEPSVTDGFARSPA
jgi:DNA-binding IclR family transcriptional regulator